MLGGLNGWFYDRVRVGITAAFGVLGENDNGRRVTDFCAGKYVWVKHTSKTKSLQKYTMGSRGQDGLEVKRMRDLVLTRKDILHYVQGVKTVRELE